jgi:glycosyltransferase involved in cell wall biosynthesis
VSAVGLPVTAIGVPVHNGERFIREALDSLDAQRPAGAVVVAVDDSSTDGSPSLLAARSIPRFRFDRRVGLAQAWRKAFALALEEAPQAKYFAWGSDHDLWDADWLRALVQALEARPQAVLAYPLVERIDEEGRPIKSRPASFETVGISDPLQRIRRANEAMRAGDMVYGLYRVEALRRCGPFPATLLPDRLLLARLAFEGEFVQVERRLWRRRYKAGVVTSLGRQRLSVFGGAPPVHARLPWWAVHAVLFWRTLPLPRRARVRPTLVYLTTAFVAVKRERFERTRRRSRRWRRRRREELVRMVRGVRP